MAQNTATLWRSTNPSKRRATTLTAALHSCSTTSHARTERCGRQIVPPASREHGSLEAGEGSEAGQSLGGLLWRLRHELEVTVFTAFVTVTIGVKGTFSTRTHASVMICHTPCRLFQRNNDRSWSRACLICKGAQCSRPERWICNSSLSWVARSERGGRRGRSTVRKLDSGVHTREV